MIGCFKCGKLQACQTSRYPAVITADMSSSVGGTCLESDCFVYSLKICCLQMDNLARSLDHQTLR